MIMEIESATRRYLLGIAAAASYVGTKVFKFRLEEQVDGTGGVAIVVNRGSGWAGHDPVKSGEYPRLFVDVVADPTREVTGEISVSDAEDKAFACSRALIPWFSFPSLRGVYMGGYGSNPGLFVISSQPLTEPRLIRPSDSHPPQAGDTVTVRTEYGLVVTSG